MKKSGVVIIVLVVLLVVAVGVVVYGVFQGMKVKAYITELQTRNNQLEADRAQISDDKEAAMVQLEECRAQAKIDKDKLNMVMEDWREISKSCMNGDSACQGKFPFMRYTCNIQGDAVDDGNKICECDQNCKLVVK